MHAGDPQLAMFCIELELPLAVSPISPRPHSPLPPASLRLPSAFHKLFNLLALVLHLALERRDARR
eukprot:3974743-Pleurochrysis_carterae.AAC.2